MLRMDAHDIRRQNLRILVDAAGSPTIFGRVINRDRGQVAALLTTKNMGSKLAREIEVTCGRPHGWMDEKHPEEWGDQSLLPATYKRRLALIQHLCAAPAEEIDRIADFVHLHVEAEAPVSEQRIPQLRHERA